MRYPLSSILCPLTSGLSLLFSVFLTSVEAATVSWVGGSGDWNIATNWSTGALPGTNDNVVISPAATITVTHSAGTHTVNSIQSSKAFVLSGGILTVTTTFLASNTITLSGGTLQTATVMTTNGASLIVSAGGSALNGLTVNGVLDVGWTYSGANLTVTNGLVLNGTALLGNPTNSNYGSISFAGSQTLGGSGTVVFGEQYNGNYFNALRLGTGGATLTIGGGITVLGQNGVIGYDSVYVGPQNVSVINQGTISASVANGTITISAQPFTNQGLAQGINGGSLYIDSLQNSVAGTVLVNGGNLTLNGNYGSWTNAGAIDTTNATVTLGGALTVNAGALGNLGDFNRSGGVVYLTGSVNNTNTTLLMNAPSNTFVLQGGTINGGAVTATIGVSLIVNGSGTLNGVTVNGTLDVGWTYSGANLTVTNGLVLNGTALLGNPTNSNYGSISFAGSQTLGGNGTVVFGEQYNGNYFNALRLGTGGATLTIGGGITVLGQNGVIGYDSVYVGPQNVSVINQGTISASVANGTITISAQPFTNQGLAQGINGGTLTLTGTWNNSGTLVESGGILYFGGSFTLAEIGTLNRTNGTICVSGTLTNTGTTLVLDANTSGSWILVNGGTILGGAAMTTNGASLIVSAGGSALNGVTVNGVLDVGWTYSGANLTVTNGLVLNGTALLGNPTNSNYGSISFAGSQTLDGSGTVVFGEQYNGNYFNALRLGTGGATLTIGGGITVLGQNGVIGYDSVYVGPQNVSVINQGTISASVSGGTIYLQAQPLVNNGTLDAPIGTLSLGGTYNLAGGAVDVGINSLASFGRIIFAGDVSFAGAFGVSLNNGYQPALGNSFAVINYGVENGSFSNYNLPNSGLPLEVNYGNTSLNVTATQQLVPIVNITSPSNNSIYQTPVNITINATATSLSGTITNVVFAQGTNQLGQALNSPYSVTWSNVPPGAYPLIATATDTTGAVGSSSPKSVIVLPTVQGTNFTWVGSVSSAWFTPGNWSPAGVPGPLDEASILNGGTATLSQNTVVGFINMASGTINGTGLLSVSNCFYWTGGNVYCPVRIQTNSLMFMAGSSTLNLYGVLTNAGTVNWIGTGTLNVYNYNGNTGGIVNLAGAVFNVQNDQTVLNVAGGNGYFSNAGLLQKSPTAGTTTIGVAFTNTGTVNVESGTVTLSGGGTGSGQFIAGAGTTLVIANGYATSGGSVFQGGGTNLLTGGTVTLNAPITTTNVVLAGATLAGNCSISGLISWTSGSTGSGGSVTILSNAVLNISGSSTLNLYGVLTNAGTVNWIGTGTLNVYNYNGNTGGIVNLAGAVFNVQNDQTVLNVAGGNGYFSNAGLLQKSPTTGTTTIGVAFTNTGTVNVQSGSVAFNGGGSGTGTFNAAVGDDIAFGNNYSGSSFNGAGTYTVNGGTVTVNGTIQNAVLSGGLLNLYGSVGNLTWNGGTLGATNVLTGSGTWTGGAIGAGASMTILSNAVLNIGGSAGVYFCGVLTNAGTVNWGGTAPLIIANSPACNGFDGGIVNLAGAVFNVENDQAISNYASCGQALGYFNNAGAFLKSPTTGTTTIGVAFTNTGTVNVESGTVALSGGGTGSGQFIAGAGTTLVIANGYAASGGSVFQGGGTNLFTGGTVTLNGLITTTNVVLAGATLAGNCSISGLMSWTSGSTGSGGSVTILSNAVLNISGSAGVVLCGVLTNAGTLNWGGTAPLIIANSPACNGFDGGIVNLAGAVFNVENDQAISNYASCGQALGYFNNAGAFLKSPTTGTTTINVAFTNTGTINVESGTISLTGNNTLNTGALSFGINGPVNYGRLAISGGVALGGPLNVNLNNGYVPALNNSFTLVTCGSRSGVFSSTSLPGKGLFWQVNYTNTAVNLVLVNDTAPLVSIGYLRSLLDRVNFAPTNTTSLFTTEGVVTTRTNLTSATNTEFYIQDATAGIAIFWAGATASNNLPPAGSFVQVTAPLGEFNGLLELAPVQTNIQEGVTILGSTNLPTPQPLPLDPNITGNSALMVQQLQGSYFVASNVFLNLTTPAFAAGASETVTNGIGMTNLIVCYNPTNLSGGYNYLVTATNQAGETFTIYYNPYTDIAGKPKGTGPFNIYGVLGQSVTNPPYTSGYQFMPTRFADIAPAAPPVITWSNPVSIGYGTALSASQLNATATFAGTNLPGSLNYSYPAGTVLNAGTNLLGVTFIPNDAVDFNGAASSVSLVVSRAPLTVVANSTTRPYGSTNPVFTGTFAGVVNGDNITNAFTTAAGPGSAVGTYAITAGLLDPNGRLGNYAVSATNGVLTVTAVPLSVTASNASRFYGQPNPVFGGTLLGVVNGDNITATYGCTATVSSLPGPYPIVPSLSDPNHRLGNYDVTTNSGTLTVNPTVLSITWPTPSPILYGTALSATQLNASANVPGSFAYSPTTGVVLNAGTNSLTAVFTPTDTNDYSSTNISASLVVLPVPLTVTASNVSRFYGQTNPVLGGILIGVTNGDNITATYATTAISNSPAGIYPIIPTLVDTNSRLSNYVVTTNNGTLTVLQLTPLVTWSNPPAIIYGTTLSGTQLNASANLFGTPAYTPPAGTVLNAGTNTLTVVFTPLDTTNYSSTTDTVSLVVAPASLSVAANNAMRSYGQANPSFTGTLAGVVNGDNITANYSCSAVALSPPGPYPIVPGLVDPNRRLGNYSLTGSNGTLTVTAGPPPTFTSITPNSGVTNAETAVTITGSGFELGAGVLFGGLSASNVVVDSGTQITAVAPVGSLGVTNVVVSNPDGTSATLTNGFSYTGSPPSILTQPASLSLVQGSNAVFSVSAQYAAGYQWLFNGGNLTDNGRITGSHGNVLTIPGVQPTDIGVYQVVVTNTWGSDTSASATLSIIVPPSIGVAPQSQSVGIGGTATFTVGVNGTAPFTYQWLLGGAALPGATNAVLSLPNVQMGNQGQQFRVVVNNPAGSATSTAAALNVLNYCVIVRPSQAVYPMGSQVPLTVQTFNCSSQAAVPNSSATVWISTGGTTRSLPATTGASGTTMVNFVPLPTETGTYQVAAALPGQSIPIAQGTFTIVGLSLSRNSVASFLTPGIPVTNTISLNNLTGVPLTGITATMVGSPPDVQVTLNAPNTLPGNGTISLTLVMLAPTDNAAQDQFYIQITTAQGTINTLPITATVSPLEPQLTATPASLSGNMVGGGQTLVNFYVANSGGATSGPVQVLLPQTTWLTTVTPLPIPPLAPGQSNQVTLALTPQVTLPLGAYTGSVELTSSNANLAVPFTFYCLSDLTGSLLVTVQDELSQYGAGSPNVTNATVTVTDFLTGSNVTSAVTDASGMVLLTNLVSAYYNVSVEAPDHGSFHTTLLVAANETNDLTAFLPFQLVDYTWVVTPTVFPDHYTFTLQTTFQTKVPWPVVTVDPGFIDLCTVQGQSNQINMTIYNSGLISAQGLNLYFGSHPNWSIQPLVTSLGDLLPESSIVVPVTITRIGSDISAPEMITAQLSYGVTTPSSTNSTIVPIYVFDANPMDCDPQNATPLPTNSICLTCGGNSGTNGTTTVQPPDYTFQTPQSVLVQVKLQIEQSAVIARDAFNATLQLVNNAGATVSNLSVTITVYDASNNVANSLFGLPAPTLNGLNAVDGTGFLAVGATGSGKWTIVPATNAAPQVPTQFKVGGSFSYILNGEPVTVPLFPVPITVLPTPILNVDYFLQHDVYSDDPFTPQIEPSIPFPLAILVKNIGYGHALDFTITSSQPKIIENSNDLVIAFQLVASQVGTNQALSPSMTMDFGNIGPQGSADGLWYMTSTLEGQFISFSASYKHTDDLGNTNTSLINRVNIHEMNHVVRLTGPSDDGLPDFLVNDTTNVDALPDIVYSSDGSTHPVTSSTNCATAGVPSSVNTNISVSVPATADWGYFEVIDPGEGVYPITSVTRSDGVKMLVGPNVWQTPMRTNMVPPKLNNLIHIFDTNSTGTYTVTYGLPILAPSVTTLDALSITPTNATLNAIVNPNGANTDVYFRWGATTNYSHTAATTTLTESLNTAQAVAIAIGGLSANRTNHFQAVGVNSAGTTFGSDLTFVTPPLPPPFIPQARNRTNAVGQGIVFTNHVQVATPPAIFSLDSSDPAGSSISTNGVFRWTPACLQGSSTNLITIWVTDSSSPPLSNSMSFTAVVGECVQLELGSTVMQVGQTGGVTVTLLSTVGLTNLNWTLANPANRFTNWAFASSNAAIANATVAQTYFDLTTAPGQTLQSPALLGTIYLTALPGPSTFLSLVASNILGTKVDGSVDGNISSEPGGIVLIGPQPLLSPAVGPNQARLLLLYGNPGTNYQLLYSTNLTTPNWQTNWSGPLSNLFEFVPVDPAAQQIFYRAQ